MIIYLAGEGGKERQEMLVRLGGKVLVSYFYSDKAGDLSGWFKGLVKSKKKQMDEAC